MQMKQDRLKESILVLFWVFCFSFTTKQNLNIVRYIVSAKTIQIYKNIFKMF